MPASFKISVEYPSTVYFDADRIFHVVDRSGLLTIDRAMEPRTLFVYLERGRRVLAHWQVRFGPLDEGEVERARQAKPLAEPRTEGSRAGGLFSVFVDDPPQIEVGDDRQIHIFDRSGEEEMDRAMSAANFAVYLERGEARLAEWQRRNGGAGGTGSPPPE